MSDADAPPARGRWAPHLARRPRGEARAAILEAARRLFAARGFAQVTVADIADAAQVGRGTLYQHWESKEDLLLACCLESLAALQARVERLAADAPLDPAAALRRVLAETAMLAAGDGGLQRLLTDLWQALAGDPPRLAAARQRLGEVMTAWEGLVAFIYRHGAAHGAFRRLPEAQAAQLLRRVIDGYAWEGAVRGPEELLPPDELARQLLAWLGS